MSVTEILPGAILETILDRLTPLFLAGTVTNQVAARHAAIQLLDAYHPRTPDELHLAAAIVSFGFHALEALTQATLPDLPLGKILRLRGSAVSLSRECHKAQRRLAQLQAATPAETSPSDEKSTQQEVSARDPAQIDAASTAKAQANKLTWTQAYEQRCRDKRIAASLQRAEARVAAQALNPIPATGHYPAMHQTA